jgi:predicted NAD-dependent protein-ADP-ribosyltransferase YbiA (DUF1768 family)
MKKLLSLAFFFSISLAYADYPASWWKPYPKDQAESWEILPQDAKEGEVILSKRTELGIFSNLSPSLIEFEGEQYASVEAFWQMMKYPDPLDLQDERNGFSQEFSMSREAVKKLVMFEAKHAGDLANKVMKEHSIHWITYRGKKFNYKDYAAGSQYHYELIYQVIHAKVVQNPAIKKLLLETGDLILKPDHAQGENSPKAYAYFDILMDIRKKLANE